MKQKDIIRAIDDYIGGFLFAKTINDDVVPRKSLETLN